MPNPNPIPNMNIGNVPKITAKTPIGKFRRDLGKFSREKIPNELLELFDWYKGLDTREINYVLELKNMYSVLKDISIKKLIEKQESGKGMSQTEINQFRLLMDIMEKSHKLKYGDKKIIENIISVKDVRAAIYSENLSKKKIVEAEVINDGNGKSSKEHDSKDEGESKESQDRPE